MLSSKRIRQHGMLDDRWRLKDKLTQYRGLIKLYKRDKKIVESETQFEKNKLSKKLDELQKTIRKDRETLHNVMVGNREMLHRTLAPNRAIQLSQQNSHPLQVIEYLEQENFVKRKQLDKLRYETNVKMQQLAELRLQETLYEEKLVFEIVVPTKLKMQCQLLAGQVEDAVLKQRAALDVHKTYQSIVQLMKKDAIFFDAIIESVRQDCKDQAYCLIHTTEMGQLAVEYMDDRRQEFESLERHVKRHLKSRRKTLKNSRRDIKTANNKLKGTIRRQSDVNLGKVPKEKGLSEVVLENDVRRLENVLDYLKKHFQATNYENIFSCLVTQRKQNGRLMELAMKNETELDMLSNKKNHAETMFSTVIDTMKDKTGEYKEKKFLLHGKIEEQKNLRMKYNDDIAKHTNLIAEVRVALDNLQQTCKPIKIPGEAEATLFRTMSTSWVDATKESINLLLDNISNKLDKLMTEDIINISDKGKEMALMAYENYVSTAFTGSRATRFTLPKDMFEYPDLERDIITRTHIKKASQNIIDMYTDSNLDLPRPDTSRKGHCVPDEFFDGIDKDVSV